MSEAWKDQTRNKAGEFGHRIHSEAEVDLENFQYSFLDGWEAQTEQFETDFDGMPNKFFTSEIVDKSFIEERLCKTVEEICAEEKERGYEYLIGKSSAPTGYVCWRMTQSASAPADNNIDDDEVIQCAKTLGLTDIETWDVERARYLLGSTRAWSARNPLGGQVLICDKAQNKKNFAELSYKSKQNGVDHKFQTVDIRNLVGATRIQNATDKNFFDAAALPVKPRVGEAVWKPGDQKAKWVKNENYEDETRVWVLESELRAMNTYQLLNDVRQKQREGANFKSQEKYLKDRSSKKQATAWQDKLHPDKTHLKMAGESSLRQDFRHIEIDNDVSPEEWANFEAHWNEARKHLPNIPADRAPTLRIRKLGRHRANGIYFPHVNTVCIDVRTSEATVHEMGHYFDLAVKDSASTSPQFSEVVSEYSQALKMPENTAGSTSKSHDPWYYKTPTEVFARGFEMYSHERLGVGGRVLNPGRFDRFDYEPFNANPELKDRVFAIFDETFGGEN